MNDERKNTLAAAACAARRRAYARFSNFQVGAALMSADGEVFLGCNVENAAYSLTICAERSAVFTAVSAGRRKFDMIAVAASGGAAPCGACRQVLAEFCDDLLILMVDATEQRIIAEHTLSELLPVRFSFERSS